MKYFFLGALAAAVMVYGFSFIYGATGSTVLRDGTPQCIAGHFANGGTVTGFALVGVLLVLAGLFFKVAAAPFHVYAPDVYEGAASPVSALLSFVPKLAGFVGLIHLLGALDWQLPRAVMWLLWCVAVLSMTMGNVVALLQTNVKRILAYSSVAHTGYMLIGLLVGPLAGDGPLGDGVAALLFYIAVYGVMNLGAFAVLAGLRTRDGMAESLSDLHGLSRRYPADAVVMAICAFSLMGFPPTAGFLGKVYVFAGAFSAGPAHSFSGPLLALAVIGVINSAIAAAYYLRIAAACYLGDEQAETHPHGGKSMGFCLTVCGVLLLLLFAWSAPLVSQAQKASRPAQLRAVQVADMGDGLEPGTRTHPAGSGSMP
ncbi:MAG: NADH-quinone oxidoreductase subunit N [bacterium]|nr:NADH-quinone oxidoreductase subunit N [bacterium]